MRIKTLDNFKIPEGIRIPYLSGRIYELISNLERKQIKTVSVKKLELNTEKRKEKIIVSMTTFPARIDVVGYAIISLFNQTMKPDKVVLWLAEEQFSGCKLPKILEELVECGLEICYCGDLKAHKKYYHALKNQKADELVITYDDDLIYPEDSIERLYKVHLEHKECIVCNRAGCCSGINGRINPYNTWKVHSSIGVNEASTRLFPSTGGGTLYPYKSVNEEVFNIDSMKNMAFTADDLWVRFMSALNSTKVIKTRKNHKTFSTLDGSQIESLQVLNCIGGENDRVIERLSEAYPDAVEFILGENK